MTSPGRAIKAGLRDGPLGPGLRGLRSKAEAPREGISLLLCEAVGKLPIRSLRNYLARSLLGIGLHPRAVLYRWRDIRLPRGIEIGENSIVGFWATLDGRRGIEIGKNVNLSSEVALWTLQHDPDDAEFGVRGGPIVIEDHAWISFRATVLPGVRIGRGAVVASNSVVTKDVAPYEIVAGIPAKTIGSRRRDIAYDLGGGAGPWFV
jgi:acetyltransferase-like isoleucine patch superfamily enzyme